MSIRTDVADALAAAMSDWTVYDYEPTVINVPALVVLPGEPYMTPDTACLVKWNIEVVALIAPTDDRGAPAALEDAVERVIAALDGMPTVSWTSASGPVAIEMGAQSLLSASVAAEAWRA
jgi:hypothetical protein